MFIALSENINQQKIILSTGTKENIHTAVAIRPMNTQFTMTEHNNEKVFTPILLILCVDGKRTGEFKYVSRKGSLVRPKFAQL